MEPMAGHAIQTDRARFERFRSELTEAKEDRETAPFDAAPTLFGKHPVYGDVAMSVIEKPAAHPDRPTHLIVIISSDDALIARARHEMESE